MRKPTIYGLIIIAVLATGILISGCGQPKVIGGDKDEHGCLIAAGYSWCESKQSCLRAWEEYCEEFKEQFKIDSFEKCVEAGNPVMESYPRQCRSGEGSFVEQIGPVEPETHYCTEEEKAAEICTLDYTPACGDDGITYGNACQACASGNIESYVMGECEKTCGECPEFAPTAPGWCAEGTIMPGIVDECGCQMPPECVNSLLTREEAIDIAKESECTQEGSLTDSMFYNENSKTWWIDLELEKEGCAPACVVSEETGTAEINWRCTGLIAPSEEGEGPGCSCPEGYVQEGMSCNPECYYSEPACMQPSIECE